MSDWPDSSLSGVSHSGNPNPQEPVPTPEELMELAPTNRAIGPEELGGVHGGEFAATPQEGNLEPGKRKEE